ncbi:LTA synthase family protein [Erysipelothrix inopinata]|uniref:LTA synthase family protein n=1 Tax=Erysipelothrix inopinata TaxID=225084 RepID=A0A7G9RWP7_9FIRM|nr:LTA synthase family protein [Erysipelothrix inopinata]QNN60022.1 LTA synthase family protein [Erysipelothrix inopinata]
MILFIQALHIFIMPMVIALLAWLFTRRKYSLTVLMSKMCLYSNILFNMFYYLINRKILISIESFSARATASYLVASLLLVIVLVILENKKIENQSLKYLPKKFYYYRTWTFVLFTVSTALVVHTTWLSAYLGNISFDQMLFNMKTPINTSNSTFFTDIFPFTAQIITISVSFIVLMLNQVKFNPINRLNKREIKISTKVWARTVPLIIFAISLTIATFNLKMNEFFDYYASNDTFIADNYVQPTDENVIFPEKKQNLVYIFSESMEATFFSKELGGASHANLLPGFTELLNDGYNFSNTDKLGGALTLPYTGWSIAGLVAQHSGIPFKIPIDGNGYDKFDFLPGITNLGDLLKKNGYNTSVILGADGNFAGVSNYFKDHGDYKIADHNSKIADGSLPADYNVWWGFEDRKLFEYGREEMLELARDGKPFAMVLETADTHFPDGFLDSGCPANHAEPYANSIQCADTQITDLIRWIQEQPFGKDTTIVVTGDHLSMEKKYFESLDANYERTIFNMILNPVNKNKNSNRYHNREFSSVDIFPTTLSSLGVEIIGNRLGLGTDLFSEMPTIYEEFGQKEVRDRLDKRSMFFDNEFIYGTRDRGY